MGNNIILFSGERGQGKTSIMQSFTKWLKSDISADSIIENVGKNKEWNEIVEKAKGNKFLVLPTIDPSALSRDESVIQALITKLFYVFSEYVTNSNESYRAKQEREIDILRKDAVPLFQKCFTNIDYLKLGRSKEWEIDDLEQLSEISNSAAFKNNLWELADILLRHICSSEHDSNFLVIPIDDTDLATPAVFNICEDIRNYFSIPNVIVIMAADYRQLTYAVTQQYLTDYRKLLQSDLNEAFTDNKCYEIAVQYLEKILPSGHRIDLPRIDALIKENRVGISFRYIDKSGSKEEELLKECYGTEKGIHNQLASIIYKRTGMIFDNKTDIHPFLPQKMRELTHFVKLLADMADIDCDEVYLESANLVQDAEPGKNLQKLKDNISMLIQYFHDYWCTKHLDISEKIVIEALDLAMRNHDKARFNKILQGTIKEDFQDPGDSFRETMYRCVGVNTEDMNSIQNAVRIFYTLYMNLWYAETLGDAQQLSELNQFAEEAVFCDEVFSYEDSVVDFKAGGIAKLKTSADLEKKTFYDAFCYYRGSSERFSLLKPILEFNLLYDRNRGDAMPDSVRKNMQYYIKARNIVANYDNQCFYTGKIKEFNDTVEKDMVYTDIVSQFYVIFSDEAVAGENGIIANVLRPYIMNMAEILNDEYSNSSGGTKSRTSSAGRNPKTSAAKGRSKTSPARGESNTPSSSSSNAAADDEQNKADETFEEKE